MGFVISKEKKKLKKNGLPNKNKYLEISKLGRPKGKQNIFFFYLYHTLANWKGAR